MPPVHLDATLSCHSNILEQTSPYRLCGRPSRWQSPNCGYSEIEILADQNRPITELPAIRLPHTQTTVRCNQVFTMRHHEIDSASRTDLWRVIVGGSIFFPEINNLFFRLPKEPHSTVAGGLVVWTCAALIAVGSGLLMWSGFRPSK